MSDVEALENRIRQLERKLENCEDIVWDILKDLAAHKTTNNSEALLEYHQDNKFNKEHYES